ncbi:hypothetical protein ACFQ7J_27255 [Streptomyces sp. NPDC056501]|uniref:hypothetical protein n=1 Tax=Streptomyces sp. NPDC056501 TaxID=3345841 RepID=UPI003688F773
MPVSIAHTIPRPDTAWADLPVRAGAVDDIEREDNARGYEPEELHRFHELVRSLVADGDHRATKAGLQARRTLGQMVPGHPVREPLALDGPVRAADDACPICSYWKCRCNTSLVPALAVAGLVRGE